MVHPFVTRSAIFKSPTGFDYSRFQKLLLFPRSILDLLFGPSLVSSSRVSPNKFPWPFLAQWKKGGRRTRGFPPVFLGVLFFPLLILLA